MIVAHHDRSMRRTIVALLAAAAVVVLGGCYPSTPITAVTAVADGPAPGQVAVVVRLDDGTGPPQPRVWVVDDDAHIVHAPISVSTPIPTGVEGACAGPDCYRVVAGLLLVRESHDTGRTYTTAWEITGSTYAALANAYPHLDDPGDLSSTSIVVHAVDGGHVVFVANGRDGVLYRDVDGRWHRLGIPSGGEGLFWQAPARLATDPVPPDPTWVAVGLTVALVAFVGAAATLIFRRTPQWAVPMMPWSKLPLPPAEGPVGRALQRPAPRIAVIATASGALAWLILQIPEAGMFPRQFYWVIFLGPTVLIALGMAIEAGRRAGPPS